MRPLPLFYASAARRLLAGCAMTLVLGNQAAVAAPVFQSVANMTDSNLTAQWCSSCGGSYRIFDQFSLGSSENITGFAVSVYSPPPYWPTDINFSIWTVAGNLPGVALFSQNLAAANFTTSMIGTFNLLATTGDVTGLTLGAGTYFASFYNPINLGIPGYLGGGGNLYQQGIGHHPGTSAGFILFNGGNSVPEPSTILLSGLALVALRAAKQLRKR